MSTQYKTFIYGELIDTLYFMPLEIALKNARYNYVISYCDTWEEAKAYLNSQEYEELIELAGSGNDEPISEDDTIDPDFLWDPELYQKPELYYDNWLPETVVDRYASEDYEYFDPQDQEKIVADLEQLGYRCIADGDLLNYAMFNEVPPAEAEFLTKYSSDSQDKQISLF